MQAKRRPSSSSATQPKDAKPVVVLTPTYYTDEKFLKTKTPVDSRPTTTKLMVNWSFSLREVLDSAAKGKSIKRRLSQLVENAAIFDKQVPTPFSSQNNYITLISFDGMYNESLVTILAGFSEFERLVYSYVKLSNPLALTKETMERLNDVERDFFSLHIAPSKFIDAEGRIDDNHSSQRALDEPYKAGGVYEDPTPPIGVCGHPAFRILEEEIDIFKGVTETTINNIVMNVAGRQFDVAPLTSLLANTMNIDDHVLAYNDEDGKRPFSIHSDMLAHIPVKYAKKLRSAILARADVIRRTCMHDIRNLQLSFLPTYINENWAKVEGANEDERLHIQTGKIFKLDDRFNIRIALTIESIYVSIDAKTTGAFMTNRAPLVIKKVWHQRDVDRRTGVVHRDAKQCYPPSSSLKEGRREKRTIEHDDEVEERCVAASSVPVYIEDDDV